MKVAIIGSGTVGRTVGRGLLALGNDVLFQDIDEKVVQGLTGLGLKATQNAKEAVFESKASFICVPTPNKHRSLDIGYLKAAIKEMADGLRKNEYSVIVIKSTVVPGTTERVVLPLLERYSQGQAGRDFGLCVNPEFLTEIHSSWTSDEEFAIDFFKEPRIVIGELDKESGDTLASLYRGLRVPIVRTDVRTAEMIKYASNCALATKISYWNEIFYICRKAGVDSDVVAKTASMDERIGKYGTIHGKAFGGKCLPKDLRAFIDYCRLLGYSPRLLKAVERINMKIRAERGVRE